MRPLAEALVRDPSTGSSVRRVESLGGLDVFFEEGVNIVVLQRALPPTLTEEVGRFLRESARILCTVEVEPESVREAIPQLPSLAADVGCWIELLADLTGCARVGVRLARVESAMCPRFHVDRVSVRLVVTYLGSGTEYVASEAVDRRFLGTDSEHLCAPDAMQAAAPGHVVLLKGEAWPGHRGRGAVHRSPRASSTEPRVVLTLDPVD